ncbi:transketolase-like TK C-terminal-containing protein [Mycolicibacterium obuense]|uniref:Pyruvate dehydrogenase E1 component n=1 Tax=Mycolicibacterium obuense TaxID=1807 RepID=A0A0M2K8H0_9MYCO|nr:pyruvate dehydrogenase [Mycolicibacterium obuense]KKF03488.1 pyruvate dehydrogenase [Mycolicibacterium obuense]
MTIAHSPEPVSRPDDAATVSDLDAIASRVLWLSTAMVHHANRIRPNTSGLKVGGHQASSASIAGIMTALYFGRLRAGDRVSVKPHASPVLHSINYLLGSLDEQYMTSLREFGGLQSYPSRTKDPDPVDYSTGSVGIGATAPIWATFARRYVDTVFGGSGSGRQYSLVGDAELDEGAIWEAVLDPVVPELGEIVWIVDMNRQSLDRVVPHIASGRLEAMFAAAGWQVLTVKFGTVLEGLFRRPGGDDLRTRIVTMANAEYQRLLRCSAEELRTRLPGDGPESAGVAALIADLDDATLVRAIANLGGHDVTTLLDAYDRIDDTRPTVILAYTIKGHGLPTQGHPQNHSSLLTDDQFADLAATLGEDAGQPFHRFDPGSSPGRLCRRVAERLHRDSIAPVEPPRVPTDIGRNPPAVSTTQSALGRTLLDLTREAPEVARRIVTVSPDVSSSTNLAGWLNKVGVWSPSERPDWFADDADTIMHWRERPTGQHMELGIAEVNLVGLLGELGATWSRWGQPLLPIGVLYDPFVERALEPWSFGIYAGGQSILVGTPSGVTLAAEGGAHQSITTPSIGLEQPGCTSYEPAFAAEVEWILLECLSRLGKPDGSSSYLRLSTRPVRQELAGIPTDPAARERRRRHVLAGAYTVRPAAAPSVSIVAMGALVTEALTAADRLTGAGVEAEVICVTSPDLLYRAIRARDGLVEGSSWILDQIFPADRAAPMVTVLDGHPHTLAFLATINRVRCKSLGVSTFGQVGDLESVYRLHSIDTDSIVGAALDVSAHG